MRRFCRCLLLTALFSGPAFCHGNGAVPGAGGADYSITVWRTENGLPGDRIRSLTQTTDGCLWIATNAGLVRFNGTGFEVRPPAEFPEELSGGIYFTGSGADGRLWLSAAGGALGSLKGGRFTVHLPGGSGDGKPMRIAEIAGGRGMVFLSAAGAVFTWDGKEIRSAGADAALATASPFRAVRGPEGRLWIRTVECLASVENGKLQTHDRSFLPLGGSRCTGLGQDRDGGVWVASEMGVARWRDGVLVPEKIPRPDDRELRFAGPLPDGSLLADTGSGMWRLRDGEWTPFEHGLPPPGFFCTAIAFTGSGGFWHAFARESLMHWRPDAPPVTLTVSDGLPPADITQIFEDREGGVWATAANVGLVRIRRKIISTLIPRAMGFNGWCTVGCESGGAQWVGTYQSGLEYWRDARWKRFDLSASGPPASVRAILRDRTGAIWAGTDRNGLFTGGPEGFLPAVPPETIGRQASALCEDGQGRLWIGNTTGLYLLDQGRLTPVWGRDLPPQPDIRMLERGPRGELWIGTWEKGLFRRSPGGLIEPVGTQENSGLNLTCLYATPAGDRVWIGSTAGLRCWYQGRFLHLSKAEGMPDDGISHITADQSGHLWLGTQRGLLRVDSRQLEAGIENNPESILWAVYDETDGLPARHCTLGNSPAGWPAADGRLCFATYGGVGIFDPAAAELTANPPVPVIEKIIAGRQEIKSPGGRCEIRPDGGRVEIHYDMPAPSAPQKTRFRYRLEGFEDRWVEADRQRVAAYSRLPAGEYRFRLAACNAAGIWAESADQVVLHVSVPFWQTRWFGITAGVAALGMAAGLSRRLATRSLRRRMRALRQRQQLDAERARIARDLHDDIGSGLTCISLLCGGDDDNGVTSGSAQEADLRRIRHLASGMTRTLDEIVWAVSPRHDSLESLATYISGLAQMMLSTAGIRCRLDFPAVLPPWPLTADERHHFYLAVKEALHNVIKHSGAGAAHIGLSVEKSGFLLSVSDNGRGPGAATPDGDGLTNMRHRMERLGGAFTIGGNPEGGTRVTFRYAPPHRDYPCHET